MMACSSPVVYVGQVECSFSTQMFSEGVAALLECVTVLVLCLFEGHFSPCLHWPLLQHQQTFLAESTLYHIFPTYMKVVKHLRLLNMCVLCIGDTTCSFKTVWHRVGPVNQVLTHSSMDTCRMYTTKTTD